MLSICAFLLVTNNYFDRNYCKGKQEEAKNKKEKKERGKGERAGGSKKKREGGRHAIKKGLT